jgi:hypothetical protein
MKRNVGRLDALTRIIGGTAVVILALLVATNAVSIPAGSAVGLAVIGTVLIIEGGTRRCLLYRVLGIDRCPVD